MLIIPAIDIKDGLCVRLRQGVAGDATVYSDDPVATALRWEREGAEFLHVVDLDGAFQGRPVHVEAIRRIAEAVKVPVEASGGLRTEDDMSALLDAGVRRVVIGTRFCESPESLEAVVKRFGDRVAAGIDARGGIVRTRGWVRATGIAAATLGRTAAGAGVERIVYTDIAGDGMMKGADIPAFDAFCAAVACKVIAAGGISSAEDVRALAALGRSNLEGAIVGKALYEGRAALGDLLGAAAR